VDAAGKLPPFAPCHKPADNGRVQLLFGEDADFAEHFPLTATQKKHA